MGNIQVTKNGPQQAAPMAQAQAPTWEPSRWLSRMMGWDPFREMTPSFPEERLTFEPAFEVKETKESYLFEADVPGIKQADLDVSLTGNRLTVTGKREAEKENKGDTYYTYERSYGSFTRSFTLPEGVNTSAIQADLREGVLSITLPKKPEAQAKKIPVTTEQKKA
jgi:HSP20 family protein